MGEGADGKRLHFADNFRSRPELLEFFNTFFSVSMAGGGDHSFSVDYNPDDNLLPGLAREDENEDAASLGERPVELLVGSARGVEADKRRKEAERLAVRLKEIVHPERGLKLPDGDGERPARFEDIAILLRRMTHASIYEEALRAAGIPYALTQSSGLYQRLEIRDLIHLVRFLVRPLDPLSRLAVLRGPGVLMPDTAIPELA